MKLLYFLMNLFAFTSLHAQHVRDQPCIPAQEMERIKAKIWAGKNSPQRQLLRAAVHEQRTEALGSHAFIWPLVPAPHFYQPGYYAIGNYVDLNPMSNGGGDTSTLRDYNCGKRTYDTPGGYDHSGIDIGIAPFGWKGMDDEDVYIRAAEGGIVVGRRDGQVSRNCVFGAPNQGLSNFIAIEHSDGSIAYYFHMKEGTVTNKYDGNIVATGEYLGVVGSSGNSTGPHLHFEIQDEYGAVMDPFQNGSCNSPTGVGSLWANEEPYFNKKILSVFTMELPWIAGSCNTNLNTGVSETVKYKNHFSTAGDFIYFSAAVRDITLNNSLRLRVYSPSGSLLYDNSFTFTGALDEKYVLPSQFLALPSTVGTYRLLCTYNGQNEAHFFTVGCPGAQTLSGNRAANTGVISGSTIHSTETIVALAKNTEYQAETYIQLNPGFSAITSTEFRARIDDCTVGKQRTGVTNRLRDKLNNK